MALNYPAITINSISSPLLLTVFSSIPKCSFFFLNFSFVVCSLISLCSYCLLVHYCIIVSPCSCISLCVFISNFCLHLCYFSLMHIRLLCANKNFLLTYLLKKVTRYFGQENEPRSGQSWIRHCTVVVLIVSILFTVYPRKDSQAELLINGR